MSDDEIGTLLNVVRSTVFRHRKSALARIKQYMEEKSMTNTSNKAENLLPFNVIAAAANGDTDAICAYIENTMRATLQNSLLARCATRTAIHICM